MAVEGEGAGRRIAFRTNVDDLVSVDADHPLRFERDPAGGVKPYVRCAGTCGRALTRALALRPRRSRRGAGVDGRRCSASAAGSLLPDRAGLETGAGMRPRRATDAHARFLDARRRAPAAGAARRAGCRTANPNGDHALPVRRRDPAAVASRSRPPCWCRSSRTRRRDVLLTQRAPSLRDHSGQIAFPGGRSTPTRRRSKPRCARPRRRSASIAASSGPLGYLDPYLSSTGFRIMPVVGLVSPGLS